MEIYNTQIDTRLVAELIARPRVAISADGVWQHAKTALAAVAALRAAGVARRVLVVANKRDLCWWYGPWDKSVVGVEGPPTERREALAGGDGVYAISIASIAWLVREWHGPGFDTIIIDRVPGRKSAAWQVLSGICRAAARVIILDDVPDAQELWGRVYLLDGGQRLGATIDEYRDRWFAPVVYHEGYVWDWRVIKGADRLIADAVRDVCIRLRVKEGVTA